MRASADHQHAGDEDVGVSVGDSAEDGVIFEEQFEAADVHAQGDDQQQEGVAMEMARQGSGAERSKRRSMSWLRRR